MSFALLMFNRNENEGILRNIRSLRDHFDEIVVIDNSGPDEHRALVESTRDLPVRVYHVLPFGFGDVLRPYGTAKVESDYVLNLDADEEASPRLATDLREFTKYDSYVVPVYAEGLRSYSYHLRLYRREAVRFRGRSFDFPEVLGTIGRLDKVHRIVHHANYASFLQEKPWRMNYFEIEDYERPYTYHYLAEVLAIRLKQHRFRLPLTYLFPEDGDQVPPPIVAEIAEGCRFLADLLIGRSLRAARFARTYNLARHKGLRDLPSAEQSRRIAISKKLENEGGVVRFLCLDNPAYLERLTQTYDWHGDPMDVYRALLGYRLLRGAPLEDLRSV